jgi:phosphoribosylglycinamide formyltransferase 1
MPNIAIFASGGGSNARAILQYFQHHATIKIVLVVSNRSKAGVLEVAKDFDVPTRIIGKQEFYESENLLSQLRDFEVDYIVLAGFLLLVPKYITDNFYKKILNIHPALLPKYGGKGMYGHFVHEAVQAAGEKSSGITIHYANEHYDEGDIIFQAQTELNDDDNATEIARKVLALEHHYYPRMIEKVLL